MQEQENSDVGLITRITELYVEDKKPQRQIAEELGISQTAVWNHLKTAEKLGIFKNELIFSPPLGHELERALLNKFNTLHSAIVVNLGSSEYTSRFRRLANQAAIYLDQTLKDGTTLTLPSGVLTYEFAKALPQKPRRIDIFPVVKEFFLRRFNYFDIAAPISSTLRERCEDKAISWDLSEHLAFIELERGNSPDSIIPKKIVDNFRKDLDRARNPDVFISSVGLIVPERTSSVGRLLDRAERMGQNIGSPEEIYEKLVGAGIQGEMNGTFFDKNGEEIELPDDQLRLVNQFVFPVIDLEHFKKLSKERHKHIIVVADRSRLDPLKIVLKAGMFNVAITDNLTAKDLTI